MGDEPQDSATESPDLTAGLFSSMTLPMTQWVYMLRCKNDSLYTGSTSNLERRWTQHCIGKGAKFTRAFPPLHVEACWKIAGGVGNALRVEAFIKKLKRPEKEELSGNPESLAELLSGNELEIGCEVDEPLKTQTTKQSNVRA